MSLRECIVCKHIDTHILASPCVACRYARDEQGKQTLPAFKEMK